MKASARWILPLLLMLGACSQTPVAPQASSPPPVANPAAPPPVADKVAPPPVADETAPPETVPPPAAEPVADARPAKPVSCPAKRMQMCAQIYDPVCATRDTGIRCVTTPCPSSERKTMGNACSACSDPKVSSYVKGECPAH